MYLKDKNHSLVDFFKDDLTKYPLLAKTKYIEIILYPGQMIYIPYKWYYCYVCEEDSLSVISSSENILTKILKN